MDRIEPQAGAPLYRYRFGATEFDESRFELSVAGLATDIEQKPLQVLAALLHRPNELLSREELLESVWKDVVLFTTTVHPASACISTRNATAALAAASRVM